MCGKSKPASSSNSTPAWKNASAKDTANRGEAQAAGDPARRMASTGSSLGGLGSSTGTAAAPTASILGG